MFQVCRVFLSFLLIIFGCHVLLWILKMSSSCNVACFVQNQSLLDFERVILHYYDLKIVSKQHYYQLSQ